MSTTAEATAKLARCQHCGEAHGEDDLRCPKTDMLLALEGRRLDGKFRFLSKLGSGGMATVYLAINERVDREVAIKFLRPEVGRDPEAVARFRSEAKAAGRIGSPHICEILDLGDSPIGPYIVMERLRGIDLANLISRQGILPPGYAVRVIRHALEGLAAAHAAGIVHRDLKPGNIFLHNSDTGETTVKLMDFGVSKFLDGTGEAQTGSGILLGTPEYMAPEQLEGAHKIGPPADIWAMGAILYRAISGQHVFSGTTLAAVLKAMALDEVTPLCRLVEGLPYDLEAVIHRCLERDLGARYASAEELSVALEPFERLELEVVPVARPEDTRNLPLSSNYPVDELKNSGASRSGGTVVLDTQDISEVSESGGALDLDEPGEKARPKYGRIIAAGLLLAAGLIYGAALVFGPVDSAPTDTEIPTQDQIGAKDGGDDSEQQVVETDFDPTGADEIDANEGATEDKGQLALDDETDDGEDTDGSKKWLPNTERPAPTGTFRNGAYIALTDPGSNTDLNGAKARCSDLAASSFAGIDTWKLPNPAEISKFAGNDNVKRGRYWSTALHKGRAWVYSMPSGDKKSEKANRKLARALCVTKY